MPTPPILFLIFNRPEQTNTVFQSIKKAQPKRLFVAADGPRTERSGEDGLCELARSVVKDVDWNCDVQTLFRDSNLGCEIAVSQAITWFFQNVESGVVLEDDCLPNPSFFPFCDELLDRFRASEEVGVITGDNFQWGKKFGEASYYFSKFSHCWGWATWRRAWDLYDHSISEALRSDDEIIANFACTSKEMAYWKKVFSSLREKQLNTWDYSWKRSLWNAKLLTATPQVNLVTNIGFGSDASHTQSEMVVPGLHSVKFPLVHPELIQQNIQADARVARKHFGLSLRARVEHRMRRLARKLKWPGNILLGN